MLRVASQQMPFGIFQGPSAGAVFDFPCYNLFMPIDVRDGKIKNARALFYKIENGAPLFLLTQEASSGSYTLPGGRKDLEDADMVATLTRELEEELWVKPGSYIVQATDVMGEYADLYDHPPECKGKPTIMSLFLVHYGGGYLAAGDGIASVIWLRETDALEKFNTAHMKELFLLGIEKLKNDTL